MGMNIEEDRVTGRVKDLIEHIYKLENKEEFNDLLSDLEMLDENEMVVIKDYNGMGFIVEIVK